MNALRSLPVDKIHVEPFCASSSWPMVSWRARGFFANSPSRTTVQNQRIDAAQFELKLCGATSRHPANRIFCFDETSWKCYLGPENMIAEKRPSLPK
jgi:hypothetical protein